MILQLALGLLLSSVIGALGHRRGALSAGGVFGAIVTGTAVFGFGGWAWGALLVAFFVSSSLLSRFKHRQKDSLAEKFSKGSRRDLAQALANGGAGAALAVIYALLPHPAVFAAFAGAMATVNADTWATELGVLASRAPRLITTGRRVEVGTSGAVSAGGTVSALAGAVFIAILAAAAVGFGSGAWGGPVILLGTVSAAGLAGSLFDSLLGATVQAIYVCRQCGRETEHHPAHRCGGVTRRVRGWAWLDNDLVNFLSSLFGAGLGAGLWWIARGA